MKSWRAVVVAVAAGLLLVLALTTVATVYAGSFYRVMTGSLTLRKSPNDYSNTSLWLSSGDIVREGSEIEAPHCETPRNGRCPNALWVYVEQLVFAGGKGRVVGGGWALWSDFNAVSRPLPPSAIPKVSPPEMSNQPWRRILPEMSSRQPKPWRWW